MKEVKELEVTDLKQRILLLSNLTELDTYKKKIARKKSLFDEAKTYCEVYLPMQDLKQFNESFTEYFKKSFIKKYRSQFPKIVSDLKMLEMSDVQLSKIEFLEAKYKEIEVEEFDFIQGKAKFIDFGLYATEPDQIERYYQTISLIQHLNNLKEYIEQGTIVKMHIAKAIRVIGYDQTSNTFKVNVNYILNGFN
jgi:hypothetical protein